MKRRQTFCLYLGLILLALCSCDRSVQNVTETDDAMAKVRRRATTMFQPSELGNWFVNPALDDEYQLSEEGIVEELMSYGLLGANESVEITPVYSERMIPLFLKSLIVEPESNEWYGIDVDEVMNMYMEFPSIAFYIINSSNNKSFITTADRRFPCNLIDYRSSERFNPEIITVQENIINGLYYDGAPIYRHKWDSMLRADYYRLIGLDISDDRFELKVCYWRFEVCQLSDITNAVHDCQLLLEVTKEPLLPMDMKWGQNDIFGDDCYNHNPGIGSIVLSILKVLCFSDYIGLLLDEPFGGAHSDIETLHHFAWQLYYDIENSEDYSQRGLDILDSCGFEMITITEDMDAAMFSQLDADRLVITTYGYGYWQIVDGYWRKETECNSACLFDYDWNKCEYQENRSSNTPREIYVYNL